MRYMNYFIGKIALSINYVLPQSFKIYWNRFLSPAEVPPDFTIEILPQQIGRYGLETIPLLDGENRLIRNGSEVMLVNHDWTHCRILSPENWDLASAFLTMAFDTHAVQRRMIHLHCSTIADRGRGVLFLGPSGIGKTTQAERWRDYRGSLIINGDMGYVQETQEGFTAWGTPWHGSSPYCDPGVGSSGTVPLRQPESWRRLSVVSYGCSDPDQQGKCAGRFRPPGAAHGRCDPPPPSGSSSCFRCPQL